MMDVFFKGEQSTEKPYRQLVLQSDEKGVWEVLLYGGEEAYDPKLDKSNRQILQRESTESLAQGEQRYAEISNVLRSEGWRIRRPQYPESP